jgi:chromate transporter
MNDPAAVKEASLAEIALVFLKLGTVAFGGPAAHLAMMEEEFVRRRRWITEAEFLDRLAAANLIPGPSSTEVAIFIGQMKRGWRGLIVAGACFIVPAAVIVSLIAWAYVRFGSLPRAAGMLYAIKPVVVAIIVQALGKLARTGLKSPLLGLIAALAAVLFLSEMNPILVLAVAGAIVAASEGMKNRLMTMTLGPWMLVAIPAAALATGVAVSFSMGRLFLAFLKIGSVVFGSGYVLLPFIRAEFVERLHWLTDQQIIDAVAVGQFTPGPVFTTATFIWFILGGWPGAVAATVAIFLPGFLLVAASGPLIPRIRQSRHASAALDGVIAASLALMAVVTWQLGRAALVDRITLLTFLLSAVILVRFKINSAWLIAAAAIAGWFLR